MRTNIVVLLIFAFQGLNISQVQQEWAARYNGPSNGYDAASAITVDAAGNIYVTGYSYDNVSFGDYATIKYNSSGIQLWVARYNGPSNSEDYGKAISVDISGNVYVTGVSYSNSTLGDFATVKYNTSGFQQWVQRYNGPENLEDAANCIAVDASGNVYVSGYAGYHLDPTYGKDFLTIKYNSSGVQQWVQRYTGPGNFDDEAKSIAVDLSGNVYVSGYSIGSSINSDALTIKYNSAGVQLWVQRYNSTSNFGDGAYSLSVDISGNVYAAGWSSISSSSNSDYLILKYNSSGIQQWVQTYNGSGNGNDVGYSLALDNLANVYVTGYTTGISSGNDFTTIKYNTSGAQLWVQTYNGTGNNYDVAYSLKLDSSANAYITGYSVGSGTSGDYATIKYNSSGVQQWVQRYNGPGNNNDASYGIAVDLSGNAYVTGYSRSGSGFGTEDYATIKYSPTVAVYPISSDIPNQFSLLQNYPNPFNPNTHIGFWIAEFGFVSLKIYDLLGNEVANLANEQLQPGTYEVEWDGSNFSSGIYYYKLQIADSKLQIVYLETRKMVLVK